LCNRIKKETIIEFFSTGYYAYLWEYMLPRINKPKKFYSEYTDIAIEVLLTLKLEIAGS